MNRFAPLSPEVRDRLRPEAHPDWVPPMLATLTDRRFSDPDWLFERKVVVRERPAGTGHA